MSENLECIKKDILNTADSMTHEDVPVAVNILCRFLQRLSSDYADYQSVAAQMLQTLESRSGEIVREPTEQKT
jgi:hypothetical protein